MLRGSGGIFFDFAVGPDLIRGGYSMQGYVSLFAYVYMYLCMYVFIVVAYRWFSIHTI